MIILKSKTLIILNSGLLYEYYRNLQHIIMNIIIVVIVRNNSE